MSIHQVIVPNVGEGIKSVQIIRYLKKVGEWTDEDNDVVEIETDKTTFEIPSIASGKILKLFHEPGDTVEVGKPLLEIEQADSPAHQKQKRRGEMPDIQQKSAPEERNQDGIFSIQQKVLAANLALSQEIVVPATIEKCLDFSDIEDIRRHIRVRSPETTPSVLSLILYACVEAMLSFDKFKCQLGRDLAFKQHDHCAIGVAISGERDELEVTTLSFKNVPEIDNLHENLRNIIATKKIERAYHSLAISDMSSLNIRRAQPVVVYPSIATLLIGSPYFEWNSREEKRKVANLCLSFDHRLINGAYAAQFLKAIEKNIKNLKKRITTYEA